MTDFHSFGSESVKYVQKMEAYEKEVERFGLKLNQKQAQEKYNKKALDKKIFLLYNSINVFY